MEKVSSKGENEFSKFESFEHFRKHSLGKYFTNNRYENEIIYRFENLHDPRLDDRTGVFGCLYPRTFQRVEGKGVEG